MRLHYLQHVPFEDLGCIADWADSRGFDVTVTRLYEGELLPPVADIDWLVVMGGPMNIYEDEQYPWLPLEKTFISECLGCMKVVIGICLGAQLIADSLGATVTPNRYKEIGWWPVSVENNCFGLPNSFSPLHWHGDTFSFADSNDVDIFAKSEICSSQAFSYDAGRVVGLQFHLEVNKNSIASLIENCRGELVVGPYIQQENIMLDSDKYIAESNNLMFILLDNIYKHIK